MHPVHENGAAPTGVDIHAHHFGADLAAAGLPDDPRWPRLVTHGDGAGQIMLGDRVFRQVHAPLWDTAQRIAELDAAGIGVQLISPTPVMLAYWADAEPADAYARATNDSVASAVGESGGRLAGLGTVPLPYVDRAVAELRRCVADLGLVGVQIGSRIAGMELDDPVLRPFFRAADELDAVVFVHPTDGGGGVIRRGGQPYDFGLGMTTDTAIAASALVFGGVLRECVDLRVVLAHGCGTFAWAWPRLRLGAGIFTDAAPDEHDDLVGRLWVDSLVFDPEHLRLLTERFGAGHVVLGTDYPFVAGQLDGARRFLASAVDRGALTGTQAAGVLGGNGRELLRTRTRQGACR
ncbi:amidohydrolase family protein [Nocardioides sp. Root151]|uniref:amidohydrolase family protein n=1 Tax=Nocardioides sp. Root151 TaxID=1736475 RepID=UPI0007030532|nr:amidohydrolase family protein [Nocardioides sp. Root151]KQZ75675.1 2-hydroxy-3-carboxy-6-oxo-7-methylocta-2,4-dienoate decarboxylase [Nocardioides sp. Root151]